MKEDLNDRSYSGWGAEEDLSEATCSTECWAFLNRTNEEISMTMEDWQVMYRRRIADGQSSKEV